jgi:hypothetical protein
MQNNEMVGEVVLSREYRGSTGRSRLRYTRCKYKRKERCLVVVSLNRPARLIAEGGGSKGRGFSKKKLLQ